LQIINAVGIECPDLAGEIFPVRESLGMGVDDDAIEIRHRPRKGRETRTGQKRDIGAGMRAANILKALQAENQIAKRAGADDKDMVGAGKQGNGFRV